MQRALFQSLFVAAMASLPGCAIVDLNKDVTATQQRIDAKQETLAAEERTQAALVAQRDHLRAELSQRKLSLKQLKARLEQMRKANDAASAATPEARLKRDERARLLNEATLKVRAFEQNPGQSEQEIARRRATLNDQTIKTLDLLFLG